MAANKREAFIEHYLITWNASEAARLAGYSEASARQQGSRLLSNADIQRAIRERLADLQASADEVLMRLTTQARASMADYVRIDKHGGFSIDLREAQSKGNLGALKKLKKTRRTFGENSEETIEIELYDAQGALALLGKHHRLFADRIEVDWMQELAAQGLDPNAVESELIQQFSEHLQRGAARIDGERVDESESSA